MITMPGNRPYHGAWWRNERPVFSIEPQEGVGGWVPSPRNESAASRSMATAAVDRDLDHDGRQGVEQDRPEHEVRGAHPERPGRDDELPLLEREGAGAGETRERGDAHHTDREHRVERSRTQNRDDNHCEQDGRDRQQEVEHAHDRRVGQSAAKPPRRPSGTPTVPPMSTATAPVRSEMRAPWITRLRMSRPNSSVPNGCGREGALNWSARF